MISQLNLYVNVFLHAFKKMQLIFVNISKKVNFAINNEKNIFTAPFYFIFKGIFELTTGIIVSII